MVVKISTFRRCDYDYKILDISFRFVSQHMLGKGFSKSVDDKNNPAATNTKSVHTLPLYSFFNFHTEAELKMLTVCSFTL